MSQLDQFYTRPEVAEHCLTLLSSTGLTEQAERWIEPSAGAGAFYLLLPDAERIGVDLEPRIVGIEQHDYLTWDPPAGDPATTVVIGNPPFGKRGKLAADFVNRSLSHADTVAMILPLCFDRYDRQRSVREDAKLTMSERLPDDAFVLPNGTPYPVSTVFQVWTTALTEPDLRQYAPLPTKHSDFRLYQYNNTRAAERYFSEPFEFAVPCQGYQDYSRRETSAERCERNKQWMLIEPVAPCAADVLKNEIDYEYLAHSTQTSTPGFRKGTLIAEYERITS